jgi:predicted MFS family arabinose efflux permease
VSAAGILRPALAGACATGAGNGLARFGFVPLFPAMVAAGWVGGGEAALLGAVNLAGYLAGTLAGWPLARAVGVPRALDAAMALVVASLAACAANLGLWWFVPWRTLAGVAGGVLMALAGPAVLSVVPPPRRGMASGVVISGVGSGVMLVSLAVPVLLGRGGLPGAWLGLAGLVAALWAFAHPRWPRPAAGEAGGDRDGAPGAAVAPARAMPRMVRPLVAYGISGAGMVAPMVYLADLAVRGRGLGVAAGAWIWLLFGLGGVAGTLLGGRMSDRIGGRRAFVLWLLVQVAAVALCLAPGLPALMAGAWLGGFAGMGVTAVALAAARERAGAAAGLAFARMTASYAVSQAAVGFALAALFAATGESHAAVFGACLGLSAAAAGVAALDVRRRPMPCHPLS